MKKLLIITCWAVLNTLAVQAQDIEEQFGGRIGEQIQSMKVAIMTRKLNLTPDQSQLFWPLYNEYESEQRKLRRSYRQPTNINAISDEEVESIIDSRFEMEEKLLKLKRNYYQKFKKVISIRQIAMIPRAENEFKTWVLEQVQKRRRQNARNKR